MEKLKLKTSEQYNIREGRCPMGSPRTWVGVGDNKWWEGLLEKVCLEFRVEESGSDGW